MHVKVVSKHLIKSRFFVVSALCQQLFHKESPRTVAALTVDFGAYVLLALLPKMGLMLIFQILKLILGYKLDIFGANQRAKKIKTEKFNNLREKTQGCNN